MVPGGGLDVGPLVDAVVRHHPGAGLGAVWCGDPHLRPPAHAAAPWIDVDLPEPSGAGWGRLLLALPPRSYEWARTAAAVSRALAGGASSVAVLRVGSVAVLGAAGLAPVELDPGAAAIALVPRVHGALPVDGESPSDADLVEQGTWSTAIAVCSGAARPALDWLGLRLAAGGDEPVGAWFDRLAELFGAASLDDRRVHAAGWEAPTAELSVVDLDALDPHDRWHFRFGDEPARVRLSAEHDLAAAVTASLPQLGGDGGAEPARLCLPGAVAVDGPIRSLVRDAVRAWRRGDGELPPDPFAGEAAAFLAWLEQPSPIWGANIGRYWRELRTQRADLQAAFPRSDSSDQDAFVQWATTSWQLEERSVLLRPSAGSPRVAVESVAFNPNGLNVVGYLGFDSSLGDVGRRIVAALTAAHVPVAAIDHFRTGSPRTRRPVATEPVARFATNLVVVNADQFHFFVADHARGVLAGRRTIAYWFWELEDVPAPMRDAIAHVDEIWTGSTFVAEAFAGVTDKPVRCVPIPVAEPTPSGRDRAGLGLPGDRFVFLVTFDHFSVVERKNPFGAIEAFRRAFPEPGGDGPVLVVKSTNGHRRWASHERVLLAAAGRDDIVVIDQHLDRDDQMAMIAAADCLVSLHRSEGLGLHCAEAMWLGTPVIATRYSGNLDVMDDSCSVLIDATMVHVTHGEGVYPPSAHWADPDLDQAAAWMRRLVAEPELGARLARAGRERMRAQPSLAATGRTIARQAGLGPYGLVDGDGRGG